jgi:hypothetical protein
MWLDEAVNHRAEWPGWLDAEVDPVLQHVFRTPVG